MTTRYGKHFSTRQTPQTEPIPGKAMVPNSGGGYAFAVDDWTRLSRFLVLGGEGGTYYASERKLTIENAECVRRCLAADARRTVAEIVAVSETGRTPKNGPAVFALALAAGMGHLSAVVEADALRRVARIPTDLFAFVEAVDGLRGWGRGLRRLIADWYAGKTADQLAYQVTKYRQRDGWTHRDLLRLAHPVAASTAHQAVYRWAAVGADGLGERSINRRNQATGAATAHSVYPAIDEMPAIIGAFREAQTATDPATIVRLIRDAGLVREHIPSHWLNKPIIWEALLDKMPMTATVRNLGKMTAIGLLTPLSAASRLVADRLGDAEHIRRSRLHPMAILLAAKVYAQGRGDKGKLTWSAVPTINDALDAAFYQAFGNVAPTGKRRLLAIDVSGSMDGSMAAGTSITCREAAAALALIVARTEPLYHLVAFAASTETQARRKPTANGQWTFFCPGGSTTNIGVGSPWGGDDPVLVPLDLSGCSRITEAVARARAIPMGGTDCSLPMRAAVRQGWEVDSFEVYTDNETWAGPIHPSQALRDYREKTGIPAKLIVQAFTATSFTIADPDDAGSLDVVGLDATAPLVVADFIRGDQIQEGKPDSDEAAKPGIG